MPPRKKSATTKKTATRRKKPTTKIEKPPHDVYHRTPYGEKGKIFGIIIHGTQSPNSQGPDDRHGVIRYITAKGVSVPVVTDDEYSTEATPDGYMGNSHAACLDGKCWGIEMISYAQWSKKEWLRHDKMLRSTAQWTAWAMHNLMDLPVNEKTLNKFVAGHDADHKFGGCSDHWDPGPGFPWKLFRRYCIEAANLMGYRVVATKEDAKKVKFFLAEIKGAKKRHTRSDRMKRWIRKKAGRGFRIIVKKKAFPADFDGWS